MENNLIHSLLQTDGSLMDMYTEKIGTKKAGQGIIYHATKCLMVG